MEEWNQSWIADEEKHKIKTNVSASNSDCHDDTDKRKQQEERLCIKYDFLNQFIFSITVLHISH